MKFTTALALIAVTTQAVNLTDSSATITSSSNDAEISLTAYSQDDLIEQLLPELIAANADIELDISLDDYDFDYEDDLEVEESEEEEEEDCGCAGEHDSCDISYGTGESAGCGCGCASEETDDEEDEVEHCAGGICADILDFAFEAPDFEAGLGVNKDLAEDLALTAGSFVQIDMPAELDEHTLTMGIDFDEGVINFVNVPDSLY